VLFLRIYVKVRILFQIYILIFLFTNIVRGSCLVLRVVLVIKSILNV